MSISRSARPSAAVIILALIILATLAAPLLTPYPSSGDTASTMGGLLSNRHLAPSRHHWLGTDELGRDVFARTLYGARVSLGIGIVSRLAAVFLGGLIGAIAGYAGGRTDFALTRLMEIFLAFPSLILAIAIGVALGPGLLSVVLAIVAVSWVDVAVLTRAVAASVSRRDFVVAAHALGDSPLRILVRHVIPNCLPTLVVTFSFGIASAVMVEASLSYLGLGGAGDTNMPSWGWMISTAEYHLATAPWAVLGPGGFLALTVFAWNALGDTLRDRLDVKADIA